MTDTHRYSELNSQKPFLQIVVSLFIMLLVSLIMLGLTSFLGRLIFGMQLQDISLDNVVITDAQRVAVKFTQALQHLSMFLVPALVVAYLMNRKPFDYLGINKLSGWVPLLFVFFLALVLIPLTGDLGVWNSNMQLPQWMSGLETWMRQKEVEAGVLTGWLIRSDNLGSLVLNIFVLAIIPALGEEFLFRGVLQQIFSKIFRSGHIAILFTAILFSASHMQFFGFLPRLLLGLVYGYLFFWSGSIWLPVLAHFINNLLPVVLAHFIGWEALNKSVQEIFAGGDYIVLAPIFLGGLLMFGIRDQLKHPSSLER